MYKQFLAQQDLLSWPLVALLLFFLTFLGVLLYVILGLRGRASRVDDIAAMPLRSEELFVSEGDGRE